MLKRNLLIIFYFFIVFLVSGCGQDPIDNANERTPAPVSHEETTDHSLNEEKPQSTDSSKTENDTNDPLSPLKVHYMNVGQADSTLLQYSHEGEEITILIDAGNWNRMDVVNYLASQNISKIDLVIGTHPDADHIGQLAEIIQTFPTGEVWLSGNTSNSQTFQALLSAIHLNEIDYYEPRMGDEFEIGPLKMVVLYPKTISEEDNEESISLKITYGDVRFVFTGDAATGDELNMLQSGVDLPADILHLGHHGSSTSTHPNFLKEVNPAIAIYSAGIDNSYGHPHAKVVQRVKEAGIKLYGTDVHGTIIVETNGKNYNILTKKDGTITPTTTGSPSTNQGTKQEPAPPSNHPCIDINSATVEELQEIVYIGPERAGDLIDLRPFQSIDDLSRIKGIGPARIKDIKSQGTACIGGE